MLLRGTGLLSRPLGWVGSAVPIHRIGTSLVRKDGETRPTRSVFITHLWVSVNPYPHLCASVAEESASRLPVISRPMRNTASMKSSKSSRRLR